MTPISVKNVPQFKNITQKDSHSTGVVQILREAPSPRAMLTLCLAALTLHLPRAPPPLACAGAGATELQCVTHTVKDVKACAAFYAAVCGMGEAAGAEGVLLRREEPRALQLGLIADAAEDSGFQPRGGYLGLSAKCADVDTAVAAAVASGGSMLRAAEEVSHGASLVPDEDEMKKTTIRQALVADPSGYPLLLYASGGGGGGGGAQLSAARLSVFEWKASQEWYESTLGWSTLRWQSNIPLEPSVTVSVGPADLKEAAGPCGPTGDSPGALLQLTYHYGADETSQAGGLRAIRLSRGGGAAAASSERDDPDGYRLTFAESDDR